MYNNSIIISWSNSSLVIIIHTQANCYTLTCHQSLDSLTLRPLFFKKRIDRVNLRPVLVLEKEYNKIAKVGASGGQYAM